MFKLGMQKLSNPDGQVQFVNAIALHVAPFAFSEIQSGGHQFETEHDRHPVILGTGLIKLQAVSSGASSVR